MAAGSGQRSNGLATVYLFRPDGLVNSPHERDACAYIEADRML